MQFIYGCKVALPVVRARNVETEEALARQHACEGPDNAREILF